jgi:hypothetical protein
VPTNTAQPTLTNVPTEVPPTSTPSPTPFVVQVEPTLTPRPGDERARVGELPLGEPGHYVNVTFGYWLQHPPEWHTGFGRRPLLVSFSDLDPGTHNRNSMRAEGCLIEINAATNIYGFGFDELMSQLPLSFPSAEPFELDGQPSLLIKRSSGDNPFDSEIVYVVHDDRLFVFTFDYARDARDACLPVWQAMLQSWQWFTPQFAAYRNPGFGYAVAHPRSWYRFNSGKEGTSFSNQDPSDATELSELALDGMTCTTDVDVNAAGLPLRRWVAAQGWVIEAMADVEIDGLVGVRVIRAPIDPGIEQMSGHFQGRLGRIYSVTCMYSQDSPHVWRPVANAIIYSFEF